MKKLILTLSTLTALFLCSSSSCKKDNDPDPNGGGNTATTLPVSCDLTKPYSHVVTSLNVSGITFTYTSSANHHDIFDGTTWKQCFTPGNDGFGIDSIWQGIVLHGSLVADVSRLPAMHKITVTVLQPDKNVGTQISLCDGSNAIAATSGGMNSGNSTIILNVDGKKASKLYINSISGILQSVAIE